MADPGAERRRKHATMELYDRGIVKQPRMGWYIRLMMRLFPSQTNPYYGDRKLFAAQASVIWTLVWTPVFASGLLFAPDVGLSLQGKLLAVAIPGLVAGIGCGISDAWTRGNVYNKMSLSNWNDLDEAPELGSYDGPAYEDVIWLW